jgi:hypothetical protein
MKFNFKFHNYISRHINHQLKLFAIPVTLNRLSDFSDLDNYFIFTVDMLTVLLIGLLNIITNKFINYIVANVNLSNLNPDLN